MICGLRMPQARFFKVLVLSLYLPFLLHAKGAITVQKPNGGERWPKGSVRTISWTSSNLQGLVKLILIKGETLLGEIETNCPANGTITWVVGDCPVSGVTAQPGRDYRLRVVSLDNASIRDDSNSPFHILAPASSR